MDPVQRRYLEGFFAGRQARSTNASRVAVPATSLPQSAPPAVLAATFEERSKRELHPLNAFPRLLACAEANLPPDAADRFRFRWFGLSYLAPWKDGFRLRLRVAGGLLRTYQVREAAGIARELGSGCVEINRHAGLDLETVALTDAPEALRRAEAAGLFPRCADGDNVVAVLADPLAGIAPGELIDVSPFVARLEQCLLQSREFADLPRACTLAFHGGGCTEGNDPPMGDIRFAASKPHPGAGHAGPAVGFRIWVAGLGDLGTLARSDQVVHAGVELLRIYLREADRSDREGARLPAFYGSWSKGRCLDTLERLLGTKLPRNPLSEVEARPSREQRSQPAHHGSVAAASPQRQPGLFAVRAAAPQGGWLSAQWEEIAHLADVFGSGRIRLTTSQAVVFPNVLDAHLKPLQETLGTRFCKPLRW